MNIPRVSILMHVHESVTSLDRAIDSLVAQTEPSWELVVATGAPTPGTASRLNGWPAADRRVKVLTLDEERGTGAALNAAAVHARGEFIGYLEAGAEMAPDFLARVAAVPEPFDVLVCGYDFVIDETALTPTLSQGERERTGPAMVEWDPSAVRAQLFVRNIAKSLGVVHRRKLLERAGGFHELLWEGEEWELWRRFARLGARFVFPKIKAGRYRVRPVEEGSRDQPLSRISASPDPPGPPLRRGGETGSGRMPRLQARPTRWQAVQLEENRRQGAPLFGTRSGWIFPRRVERILFTCVHCLLDYTNGASLAVLQALRWLNGHGFSAKAFCVCNHANPESEHREALNRAGMPPPTARDADVWQTIAAGIPVTMKHIPHNDPWKVTGETRKFLAVYERLLAEQRPDVVVTYGGDCLSLAMMEAAKYRDIPIVFWLHNFGYPEQSAFQFVDRVLVPSEFSRAYHWQRVGVDCCALPNLMDWERVQVAGPLPGPFPGGEGEKRTPKYVTFVNPEPNKGVFVFARIAAELAARRPDIPLLVVEGRTPSAGLKRIGIDLSRLANVRIMPRTADPRDFYKVTKLALMPSLWNESFGLVAAEAMINGIPVLASNRGALPEVVGEAGFLFDVPARYAPETRDVPTADEVRSWIETIIRLWDDPEFYLEASRRAHERAQLWHPQRLGPRYEEFFANVSPQPCPPLVPRQT